VSGSMVWSLRFHNKDGGFYNHRELPGKYAAYHYPGFQANSGYGEIEVFDVVRCVEWSPLPEHNRVHDGADRSAAPPPQKVQ
jgi:hypothetical protein